MATQCQLWTSLRPSHSTCGQPNMATRSCKPICSDFSIDPFKQEPHVVFASRWLGPSAQPLERSSFGRRPDGPAPAFRFYGYVSLHFPAAHYGAGAIDFSSEDD